MALQITPTERHGLQLLANGYTTNDVATALGMDAVETERLLKRLFAALGAATRGEAIALARKRGLVSWDQTVSATDSAHDQVSVPLDFESRRALLNLAP